MKEVILNLIETKPKHYVKMISLKPELLKWVKDNTLVITDNLQEMIYSAIKQESNICQYGNRKQLKRFSQGYIGCGPSNICKCTLEKISNSVTETKAEYSKEKREEINTKRNNTMIEKFGVPYSSQREDIHHIWKKPKIEPDIFNKLSDFDWLNNEYNINKRTAVDIADELKVYYSTVIDYCSKHGFTIRQRSNYSLIEVSICKFLDEQNIQYEVGNHNLIKKELDIYIPSANLAIEVNGLYWHSYHPSSEKIEDKDRHITKSILALEQKVNLFHVTDFEWNTKTDIIKSMLMSKLGKNQRIFARKCEIKTVNNDIAKVFINQYHLQGFISGKLNVGLYYDKELVSIMTVGKTRFTDIAEYELLRYCTKSGLTIVGGGSKMLHELKKSFNSIVSYCDLSKSTGDSYKSMGFAHIKDTGPGYFWTDGNKIISRFKAQRKQLSKWLTTYDPKLSESENMFAAKYRRFHDCGNRVFLLT